jgi:hypothetical protein
VRSFHVIHTLGTMCNLSLAVWETFTNTLSHVVLKIFVDQKNCDLIFIGEFKILNTSDDGVFKFGYLL